MDGVVGMSGQTKRKLLEGGSTFDQLMPIVLFIILYNRVNITAAVVAATLWSFKAAVSRRRHGLDIGWWLPTLTIYLIARSAVTILVERNIVNFGISPEAVYFGIGFITKILIGVAVAVTIIAGRPVLAWVVPKMVELHDDLLVDPRYMRTMATTTWLIVIYEIGSGIWDIWLFNNSGFNLFFLTRSVTNFVVSFLAISVGLMYIDKRLEPIDTYPGIAEVLESSGRLRG